MIHCVSVFLKNVKEFGTECKFKEASHMYSTKGAFCIGIMTRRYIYLHSANGKKQVLFICVFLLNLSAFLENLRCPEGSVVMVMFSEADA